MAKRHQTTEAEKTAVKISKIVNDVTLDLDQVGIYLARVAPNVSYSRLQIIAESAQAERDRQNVRTTDYLW
jgi:hypothetical protein